MILKTLIITGLYEKWCKARSCSPDPFLSFFYVEKQVPFFIEKDGSVNQLMCQGPAPIFRINLLLAVISFGIAAESFHILKCGHGSLSRSRHHLTMSCKNDISVARESDSSDGACPNVFRLILKMNSVTFTLIHGKAPFGQCLFRKRHYTENRDLPFFLFVALANSSF